MRIQRTSQMITASVIFFSLLTVVSAIISLRYRTLQEANYAARRVASGALRQLGMGSDRLTTAVRAYAATGDRRDYDEFFRELNVDRTRDIAVEQLTQIELTPHERSLLTQAKQNSDRLVGLENRALEAAAKKDHAAALALVYGDEYRTAKAAIMEPIAECTRSLDVRLTGQAETLSHQSRLAGYVALAATVANGAAILAALLLFYGRRVVNPLASLNQSLRDLLARKPGVSIGHQQDSSEIGEAGPLDGDVPRDRRRGRAPAVGEDQRRRGRRGAPASRTPRGVRAEAAVRARAARRRGLRRHPPVRRGQPAATGSSAATASRSAAAARASPRARASPARRRSSGRSSSSPTSRPTTSASAPRWATPGRAAGRRPGRDVGQRPGRHRSRVVRRVHRPAAGDARTKSRELTALRLEVLQRNLRTRELLEQVRETEQFFRGVLELAPDGLMVVNADGDHPARQRPLRNALRLHARRTHRPGRRDARAGGRPPRPPR